MLAAGCSYAALTAAPAAQAPGRKRTLPSTFAVTASAMAKALVIPASLLAGAAFIAPSSSNLRASAPQQRGPAPNSSNASSGSAWAPAALAGAVAVGAAGARRASQRRASVAVRAENPRAEKLRTMEKTVQVTGEGWSKLSAGG